MLKEACSETDLKVASCGKGPPFQCFTECYVM